MSKIADITSNLPAVLKPNNGIEKKMLTNPA